MNDKTEKLNQLWATHCEVDTPLFRAIRADITAAIETDDYAIIRSLERKIARDLPEAKTSTWVRFGRQFFMDHAGDWYVTAEEIEHWSDLCLFANRDYFPGGEWAMIENCISRSLNEKRRSQTWHSYKAKGGPTIEHRQVLAQMRFEMDFSRGDWVSLHVDGKRPLGNSSKEYDIADAIGLEPDWLDEDGEGEMPADVKERLWVIFDELPFALTEILMLPEKDRKKPRGR